MAPADRGEAGREREREKDRSCPPPPPPRQNTRCSYHRNAIQTLIRNISRVIGIILGRTIRLTKNRVAETLVIILSVLYRRSVSDTGDNNNTVWRGREGTGTCEESPPCGGDSLGGFRRFQTERAAECSSCQPRIFAVYSRLLDLHIG